MNNVHATSVNYHGIERTIGLRDAIVVVGKGDQPGNFTIGWQLEDGRVERGVVEKMGHF